MAWFRRASIAVAGVVAATGLTVATFAEVAQAQRQPQATPAPVPGQQRQQPAQQQPARQQPAQQQAQGAAALGSVVDQLFATSALLNTITDQGQLRQLLQARTQGPNPQAQVVFLNERLTQNEQTALRQVIQESRVLRRAVNMVQRVVRADPQLQQVLQQNNVRPNQVVAINLVGQPLTVFAFRQPITQPGQQIQPGQQVQPGQRVQPGQQVRPGQQQPQRGQPQPDQAGEPGARQGPGTAPLAGVTEGEQVRIGNIPYAYHGLMDARGQQMIRMEADNYYFEPTFLRGAPGQTLTIELYDESGTLHNFSLPSEGIDQNISPNGTVQVQVTFPQSGVALYYCKFHSQLGMNGQLLADGAQPQPVPFPR